MSGIFAERLKLDMMSSDGSVFKKIRESLGLSQEEMARMMDSTRGTVVNLENGRTGIVTGSVLKFCQATGASLLEIITECYPEYCGDLIKEDARYKERLRQTCFATRRQAKDEIIGWLTWYNSQRLHSSLGYVSPMEYERRCMAAHV